MNEPFFPRSFPGKSNHAWCLQIEAMAQVGGVLALYKVEDPENYSTYFLKIDKVRFKQKVIPGDTLVFPTGSVDSYSSWNRSDGR